MNGPRTAEFEALVADYVGAAHAVAVSSCTTALHLALLAAGVGPGDEVVCPSFSFIATANAIRYAGATPVFVDIDPRTYNLDAGLVEAAITPRTRAILPVSQIGLPADIPAVMEVAAPARPGGGRGRRAVAGREHPRHAGSARSRTSPASPSTPGRSSRPARAAWSRPTTARPPHRIRLLRAHAASVSTADRDRSAKVVLETYPEVGFNYKITDIQAAIGVVQMGRVDEVVAERQRLGRRYDELLAAEDRVVTPYVPAGFEHVYQSYTGPPADRAHPGGGHGARCSSSAWPPGASSRSTTSPRTPIGPGRRCRAPSWPPPRTILLPMFVGLTDDEQDQVVTALAKCL